MLETNMIDSPYLIRNYRHTDYDSYIRLRVEAESLEPSGCPVSPQFIAEHLGRPDYSPVHDLFVIEIAGKIRGYMDITSELTIGRLILDCWIHPEHRRRGLATQLLGGAVHRARELGVSIAHVNVMEDNIVAKKVLSRLGFAFVRRFRQLRLDISKVHWHDFDHGDRQYLYLRHGEEAKLAQIQNRSFAGTWGYNPNTVEEIIHRIRLYHCSPEDIILTYDGDKIVGYCWTRAVCGAAEDEGTGQIFMLGVEPDCRGRGIGRGVLLAGLSHLKDRGLRVAELTVDSGNETACRLYQSLGFEVRASSLWYERIIT